MKKDDKKLYGIICTALGGIFVIAGIVLFILNNYMNLYAQKTVATILSEYNVTAEDGSTYKMLEICFKVRGDLVTTTMEMHEDIPPEKLDIEVYYNIKKPRMILDAGWNFLPLLVSFLGLLIVIPGLSFLEILGIKIFEQGKDKYTGNEKNKRKAQIMERLENNVLPFIGAVGITVFGIIMVVLKAGWWYWIFIVGGGIMDVYFGIEIVPALLDLRKENGIRNIKAEVIDTDMSLELKKEEKKSLTEDEKRI